MDRILAGLITASGTTGPILKTTCPDKFLGLDDTNAIEESDYVTALLREPTASHVMERIVKSAPQAAFDNLWAIYFESAYLVSYSSEALPLTRTHVFR